MNKKRIGKSLNDHAKSLIDRAKPQLTAEEIEAIRVTMGPIKGYQENIAALSVQIRQSETQRNATVDAIIDATTRGSAICDKIGERLGVKKPQYVEVNTDTMVLTIRTKS